MAQVVKGIIGGAAVMFIIGLVGTVLVSHPARGNGFFELLLTTGLLLLFFFAIGVFILNIARRIGGV